MVTELSKWKNLKEDNVYFQPEDNRENKNSQIKKYEKNNRFKHELKMTCLFNFLRLSEVVEKLGKNSGESSHTWQL